jgi:hypothetical protein
MIQALLTKGPEWLTIDFADTPGSFYFGGAITISIHEHNWRAALCHELSHAIDRARHPEQPQWLEEVIACWAQAQMGYPVGCSVTYDPAALTGELLTDYTVYVLFGHWLERQSPGAVKRVCESDLVGVQAVESVCGAGWRERWEREAK